MAGGVKEPKTSTSWTSEVVMQFFKEGITAVIGIVIVAFTVYLAVRVIGYVGREDEIADAKDVLLLMLGLAGVVLGYYFGRMPADARAAQAQAQANAAAAQTEQINAKAQAVADEVEQVMGRMTQEVGVGRGGVEESTGTGISDDLQQIRDSLRGLVAATRRRG